jgi:hypothetical protein
VLFCGPLDVRDTSEIYDHQSHLCGPLSSITITLVVPSHSDLMVFPNDQISLRAEALIVSLQCRRPGARCHRLSDSGIPRSTVRCTASALTLPTCSRCYSTTAKGTDCFKWCGVEAVDEGLAERPCDRQKRVANADLLPDHSLCDCDVRVGRSKCVAVRTIMVDDQESETAQMSARVRCKCRRHETYGNLQAKAAMTVAFWVHFICSWRTSHIATIRMPISVAPSRAATMSHLVCGECQHRPSLPTKRQHLHFHCT